MHCQTCIFSTWKIPLNGDSPSKTGSSWARVHDPFLSELIGDLHEESRDLLALEGQKWVCF